MAKLRFIESDNPDQKVSLGMIAKDGEFVPFHGTCDCTGPVSVFVQKTILLFLIFLVQIWNLAIQTGFRLHSLPVQIGDDSFYDYHLATTSALYCQDDLRITKLFI